MFQKTSIPDSENMRTVPGETVCNEMPETQPRSSMLKTHELSHGHYGEVTKDPHIDPAGEGMHKGGKPHEMKPPKEHHRKHHGR